MVYQGTLSTNGGHYDLRAIFTSLVAPATRQGGEQGVTLDIYPARPQPEYADLAAATPEITCREPLEPSKLLQELAGYDLGWAGFNATLNGAHLDTVLPNKLFEYLGCGLPVLTLRHHALQAFVEQHGVGIVLDSADHLGRRLDEVDVAALRSRVAASREGFTMGANLATILGLYDTLTSG